MTETDPTQKPESVPKREPIPAWRDTFVHFLFASHGNEPILLHLLNAVLESDGQQPAGAVEVRNPFNPATFITEKYTILDVKATDQRGGIFQVEFQTSERASFADRMTYYAGRTFGGQMSKNDSYSTLRTVLAIAVTTFEMFRQLPSIHNSFRLTAKADSSVVFTDKLQMHVLEACAAKIGRVGKLSPPIGAWINFFFYAHLINAEEMMALIQNQPEVAQAYEKYRQFNQDEHLRAVDEAHQRYLHDLATDIEEAEKKGIAIGVDKTARNMKNEGFDAAVISRVTGLSLAEIEQLT